MVLIAHMRQLAGIALEDLNVMSRGWSSIGNLTAISLSRDVYGFVTPSGRALWYRKGQHIRWEFVITDDMPRQRPKCRACHDAALPAIWEPIFPEDGQILRSKVYQFHAYWPANALQPCF